MCSTAMPSMRPAPNIRAGADPRWSPRRKRFRPQMMTVEYSSDESFRKNSLLTPNLIPPMFYFQDVTVYSLFRRCLYVFEYAAQSTRSTKVAQSNEAYDE